MPSLSDVQASNASWTLPTSYTPVFVVVGGTSGIGQGIAEALVRHTHGNAQILIVGRNRLAATKIIARFPAGVTHEFIECDLTSIATTKRVCAQLVTRFPQINLLVMTAGAVALTSTTTEEGLETSMALVYYARWAIVDGLLPALRSAQEAGQDARVFSVLNAGMGKPMDFEDLGLKKRMAATQSLGGLLQSGLAKATYMDLMIMAFAKRNPTVPFVHASPGAVSTPLWGSSPNLSLRLMGYLIKILYVRKAKSIEQCGEHQLYAIRHVGPGASRTGPEGDDLGMDTVQGTEEDAERLWAHTVEIIEGISD
ncbi:NAD(P)-binding protein [Mycena amicta]|nr:NAD(P)-binding protein [Mycena amicta]